MRLQGWELKFTRYAELLRNLFILGKIRLDNTELNKSAGYGIK